MQVNTIFDRLVVSLSKDERRALLDTINKRNLVSEEPLSAEEEEKPDVDLNALFGKLGFLQKVIFFLKSLFSGKNREELLEERALNELAKEMQQRSSGSYFDFSRGQFLPAFAKEVRELRDGTVLFAPVIAKVLGQNKADFIAFLTGMEQEEAQRRLLRETDPYFQVAKFVNKGEVLLHDKDLATVEIPSTSELSDVEVRRMMENSLDDILQCLPAEARAEMYQNMKFLQYLSVLTAFPFDRLLQLFYPAPDVNPIAVKFSNCKDLVMRLAEILHSMSIAPSSQLVRSMFLFVDGEKTETAGYNLEEEYADQMKDTDLALRRIRNFNAAIPMALVARYLSGNVNYHCPTLGGGEDWFALLKQFWKGRIDQSYKQFCAKRRQDEIVKEIHDSLGNVPMVFLENYVLSGEDGPVRGTYSLSTAFLKTFFLHVFPRDFNRHLKLLLIEGEFYKEDNRTEFTDAYNGLLKLQSLLENFEARLADKGELREALRQAEGEISTKMIKQKKIKALQKKIDLEAQGLVQNTMTYLQALSRILNGILHGEVGGRYDTLSNFSYIGGRGNQAFLKNLDLVLLEANRIAGLIEKLYVLENSGA